MIKCHEIAEQNRFLLILAIISYVGQIHRKFDAFVTMQLQDSDVSEGDIKMVARSRFKQLSAVMKLLVETF